VLATGATDRVAPLQGWTLPGVYTLGASQVVLKEQGCLIGREVVFCGSSPLLYLVALQYARLGARVSVLDTTRLAAKVAAIPRLAAAPTTLAKGFGYMAGLKRAGALMRHGVRLLRFEGEDGVTAVHYRDAAGAEHRVPCDAVAYGFGLRPEAQLAELAGVKLHFDAMHRQWFPFADDSGRCGNCIYVAGDGAAIGGSEGATVSGRLAALALLADRVQPVHPGDLPARLLRLRRFQRGVAQAFAWPHEAVAALDDAVPVCRCENVTAGQVRAALRQEFGGTEVNRMKAATRCGMGRCQGRYCDLAASELTAATLGRQDQPLDRLRVQPPVKPLPIATAALDEDWP
jgi:NADPH-dependent 2,4-dienoyl-CoA reductase/sulfur reductase-like enzyme